MEQKTVYVTTATLSVNTTSGRQNLLPGSLVRIEDLVNGEAVMKDALEHKLVEARVLTADGILKRVGEKAPKVVTKTHEVLDAEALKTAKEDVLIGMVAERISDEPRRNAVVAAIRADIAPGEAARAYLMSSYIERDETEATLLSEQTPKA